ncbi:Protein of unknown function [Paramicrobacterium humi]|uniref:DUF3159 domain-containing protein n=1 Tax=Paramicrobacterium humi TaxID=640635 RepID=A0A1H4QLY4_9MICO|nr:DUF3159 domain-containing protein [Microbacterium humi]SEC20511.1 Protein of unknown function [Microbacterium humi]
MSGDDAHKDAVGDSVRRAAASSNLANLTAADTLTGRALLAAMGGVRGILEAVLPGLLFLVVFTVSQQLIAAIVAAGVVGVLFAVVRLAQRQSLTQALAGLVGIALSAGLALLNDKPEDYYVLGFWTNGTYLAALLISVLIGWPLVGVVVGLLTGEGANWRGHRALRRIYGGITLVWAAMFAARLVVQLPLYFAGNVEALGALRLLMGVPLYAPVLVATWLVVSAIRRRTGPRENAEPA